MTTRSWEDKRKRLQLAREHAGYRSARQAAMSMGWVYPTYASHENGIRDFPQKVAERYARAFRVAPEFIMFGTNPPDWYRGTKSAQAEMVEVEAPTRSLRFFNDDEAYELSNWLERPIAGPQFFITDPGNLSPKSIAVKVQTDEMRAKPPAIGEKEIHPGDTAIIDTERRHVRPGDIAAILVNSDPFIHLRKVVMSGNKHAYVALNRDHGQFDDRMGDVIGRVMWVLTAF